MSKIATERVFAEDANGINRLVAGPGDVIPTEGVTAGVVQTPPDAPHVAPLHGYDELSEAEILAKLPELEAETLEVVRAYEQAHQARGSITRYGLTLTPVDIPPERAAATATTAATPDDPEAATSTSSSPAEPFEGYDELNAKDVVARLKEASEEEVAAVKAYEAAQEHPRKTVVEFEPAAE